MTTFLTGIPSHESDEIWDACVPYLDLVEKKDKKKCLPKIFIIFAKMRKCNYG